jgi:hypothetical protein
MLYSPIERKSIAHRVRSYMYPELGTFRQARASHCRPSLRQRAICRARGGGLSLQP